LDEFFEIAYAAVSNRLCFFTGTGFSKAVTGGVAPSWQKLLESVCDRCEVQESIKNTLFPQDSTNPLTLEESAQVISIELLKDKKLIHLEISEILNNLELTESNDEISRFLSEKSYRVITTNYDKLIEKLAGESDCHSITPGQPIPRSRARVKVFHVHGSIDVPKNMVVTSDDYLQFMNSESYYSRKMSTVLHENAVVILGYSLSDMNLKAIMSDYKRFSKDHIIGSNIFLIARSEVHQHIKDYYSYCYGIRVLDDTDIHDFFHKLNAALPGAEDCVEKSIENIKKVLSGSHSFSDSFLKIENSFYQIFSSLGAVGLSINDERVVKVLGAVISKKKELTDTYNAWEQYEHLARWLIHLASILELKGTSIEDVYLESTLRSMTTMRKGMYIGYSWHAYNSWNARWGRILPQNRTLIRTYILENTDWEDALSIVHRG